MRLRFTTPPTRRNISMTLAANTKPIVLRTLWQSRICTYQVFRKAPLRFVTVSAIAIDIVRKGLRTKFSSQNDYGQADCFFCCCRPHPCLLCVNLTPATRRNDDKADSAQMVAPPVTKHESAEFLCASINIDAPARAAALHADRMRATGRSQNE